MISKVTNCILKLLLLAITCFLIQSCSQDYNYSGEPSTNTGQGGSMARFTISNDYLYTVDRRSLRIFNIYRAEEPELKNTVEIGFDIETIFSRDKLLFIGAENAMYIYSIKNPTNPTRLSTYSHIYSCDPVVANDKYAFVTLSSSGSCGRWQNELDILDISDPTEVKLVTTYNMVNPKGLGLKDNLLFLCDDNQLKVYDISDLYNLQLLKTIDNPAYDVIPLKNNLITIAEDGFYQYEYSENIIDEISRINVTTVN